VISVERVDRDRRGMRAFIDLPYRLYEEDVHWVPPLRLERRRFFSSRNPFLKHGRVACFLARRGGQVVGRVTAHVDDLYNRCRNGTTQGFFGFYESVEDIAVARELMEAAETWLRSRGMNVVMGPFNFSTNHEVGFLTEGFDYPPAVLMPHTKPYYPGLFHQLGYGMEKELLAYWLGDVTEPTRSIGRVADRVLRRWGDRIEIRNMTKRGLASQLRIVLDVYNEAWGRNWGFVPMTEEEIADMARDLKLTVDPDITFIIYIDGEPAAFLIGLPDINRALAHVPDGRLLPTGIFRLFSSLRRLTTIRVPLMGVKSRYRKQGLDLLLYHLVFRDSLTKTPYRNVEMSWILEDNMMMRSALRRMGAHVYKRYAILGKSLEM